MKNGNGKKAFRFLTFLPSATLPFLLILASIAIFKKLENFSRIRKKSVEFKRILLKISYRRQRNSHTTNFQDQPMAASEAQTRANQANSLKAKGPVSASGKARSRANSYKHGLTGAGVVLPNEDAAEVEAMFETFARDFQPTTGAGEVLVRRMATLAVRLDRCVLQETAALSDRVRQAETNFEAPEGVDAEIADQLRTEAGHRAMFDASKEACLARKYEATAERGFFKALKELRLVEKEAKATFTSPVAKPTAPKLGSFFPAEANSLPVAKPKVETPVSPSKVGNPKSEPTVMKPLEPTRPSPVTAPRPTKASLLSWDPTPPTSFELSFAVGRSR